MRQPRRLAIKATARILEKNYNLTISAEEGDDLANIVAGHMGQDAFDVMADEIELALKEYGYILRS